MLNLSVKHPDGRIKTKLHTMEFKNVIQNRDYLSAGDMLESQVKFDEIFKKTFNHTMSRCSL